MVSFFFFCRGNNFSFCQRTTVTGEILYSVRRGFEDQEEGGSVDSLTTGTLVQLLAGSQYSDEYSKIASEEMSVGTPKDVARREIRTAFLKIALDEVRFRLDEVASAEVFDAELYNGLQTRLKQLGTALKQAASEDVPMPGQG